MGGNYDTGVTSSYHGVTYNQKDFVKAETIKQENGSVRYCLFLKNQEGKVYSLTYPEQSQKNNSSASFSGNELRIEMLAYGNVSLTNGSDRVVLKDCNSCFVDASNPDGKSDRILTYGKSSKGNVILGQKGDIVGIGDQCANFRVRELTGTGTVSEVPADGSKHSRHFNIPKVSIFEK